jgi:hypothetical protein
VNTGGVSLLEMLWTECFGVQTFSDFGIFVDKNEILGLGPESKHTIHLWS